MKKLLAAITGISLVSTPAIGQVRPNECRPVFPIVDQVAAAPADVIAEPIAPAPVARRGFFGLPFLLPLLAAAGGAAALIGDGDNDGDGDPVSPA